MTLPSQPVTLTVEQVAQLNRKLSTMRHDINNHLSVLLAAVELIRSKPEAVGRMITAVAEQPRRISDAVAGFSAEFEKALGIMRN